MLPKIRSKNIVAAAIFLGFVAAVAVLIFTRREVFGNIILIVFGFGAVVLVHEFGHFIVAKLGDIHVEAFSIGFPPILVGLQRVEGGLRVRILPDIIKGEQPDKAALDFVIPMGLRPGETEYRNSTVRER